MSKISVAVVIVILLSLSGWAHDPQPVATISIEDISKKGAPVKFSVTADAYADINPEAILPDGVGLYVEENNLQFENVSDKTIAKMIVVIRTTDVRGNMGVSVRHFSNNKGYMPGFAGQALATLTFPSGRKHCDDDD